MDKIKQIITDYPKHFSQKIQKTVELKSWVMKHTLLNITEPFPAHVYSALYQVSNSCDNGKMKKFKSVNDGFVYCGKANACQCCRNSVSKKVSDTKQLLTKEDIENSNQKRIQTTVKKYGVTNNGQISKARIAHALFYKDIDNVNTVTNKIKQTKLENHGNERFNNRTKSVETCMKKYGVRNPWSLSDAKQNPNLEYLRDKDKLLLLFPKFTVEEIATKCNSHIQTVYHYLNLHGFREPYKSTFEQEIVFFLKELGVTNIITNTRTLIGKELDIVLPDYNLAIEYNGIYWHHDQIPHITKTYHYDKFKLCEDAGITLFTVFGNSWKEKKEIWKDKIRTKILQSTRKVFARNTTVVELTSADTRQILDKNHIQGYCTAKHCYGLLYDNEIVAVMTFSPKRAGIGKSREEGSYELVRYVTSCNVVGGASKLLKYFERKLNPTLIYSYSDNQYSTGAMYKLLGFTMENENKSGYWYYDPVAKKQYHRFNFTKSKLVDRGFDSNSTEYKIMCDLGYLRVWDCGSRTWIMKFNSNNTNS
jgi:hypothetical protein